MRSRNAMPRQPMLRAGSHRLSIGRAGLADAGVQSLFSGPSAELRDGGHRSIPDDPTDHCGYRV